MSRAAQVNWSRLPNHNPPRFYTAWVKVRTLIHDSQSDRR
jgi:hypothetical protein